ncbi:hypothetical protein ONZ45_g1456 [Pleurotus djamor]|nr:hypothetical protein ONZ45_g1456 [Pleurotus djamor]
MSNYLPNFGRPEGRVGPVGLWKYQEPNTSLPVNLVVVPARGVRPTSRDSHWMFAWDLAQTGSGQIAQRRCHLVQEPGFDHLTSWGAITDAVNINEKSTKVVISIKNMTLAQRQAFERIANAAGVVKPNGQWNCQDWCKSILTQATAQGLVTAQEAQAALDCAQRVPPAA